jgi:hypothetical protein
LPRNSISPLIISKGIDQIAITNKFSEIENQGNVRNLGNLVVELS